MPSTRRRRTAGWLHLGAGVLLVALVAAGATKGLLMMAALLGGLGVWNLLAAWEIAVRDSAALDMAGRNVTFTVGHASAAVSFDGWRSRPVWNVLVFSSDDPPTRRALVRVDAVTGSVVEKYEEAVGG